MARQTVIDLDCDNTVKFEKVGQAAEGYFLGSKTITTDYGPGLLHVFKGESGNFGVFGSKKLNDKLARVPAGHLTFIVFDGKVKIPGGKTMKNFSVDWDDEISIEVSAPPTVNYSQSSEPEALEESNDMDDSALEASESEDAPLAELTKKPLMRSPVAATAMSAANQARTQNLLSKMKR